MKAVMISIQPKWVEKIVIGEKTIEVRKTAPKLETPFKCYIYKTKATKLWSVIHKGDHFYGQTYDKTEILSFPDIDGGKVIGEFICDEIIKAECGDYCKLKSSQTCLIADEIMDYATDKNDEMKHLYGLHISNLKIYDKPKEISEFRKRCIDKYEYCQGCIHGLVTIPPDEEEYAFYHGGNYEFFDTHCMNYLTRPPQSWCYVEI